MRVVETDVVILGAGASGLAAADVLRDAEVDFLVLEARLRVGGRIHSFAAPRSGIPVEGGAEFIHGRPQLLLDLVSRAGLAVEEADGTHLQRTKKGLVPVDEDFVRALSLLGEARGEDGTVEKFLKTRGEAKTNVGALARMFTEGFYATAAKDASATVIGAMARAMSEEEGGDELKRITEGYGALMSFLAAPLGERLWLGAEAQKIQWKRDQVRIRVQRSLGETVEIRALSMIYTLPPTLLVDGAVTFTPPLKEKVAAAKKLDPGPVTKILVELRAWPEGMDPEAFVFLHDPDALVPTWWRHAQNAAPLLQGWCAGPAAVKFGKQKSPERSALESLAKTAGVKPAKLLELAEVVEVTEWRDDPYARTGYAGFPEGSEESPNLWAQTVEDTIFFAGEATRLHDAGTVHGALASGYEAAAALMQSWKG